jgi:hypothetical protein
MKIPSSKNMSPVMKFCFSIIFPWSFLIVGAILLYFGVREVVYARVSLNWPHTPGKVVSSSVAYDHEYYVYPKILYEFYVNGTKFGGDRVVYGGYRAQNDPYASRIVEKYPKEKEVTVYYMPDNPEECLLEPGIKWHTWLLPGVGGIFFIAGCFLVVVVPKLLRRAHHANEPNTSADAQ